ncbi:hypothetical protein KAR91_47380 [Candidatus Pacearchaeota archaeon]|nr:hypothetical protein [Candidatus Pacearchaeota archaeon]
MIDIYDDIKTKPVIIVGQGPSVQQLKDNIELFDGQDVLWSALNRFHIIEKDILSVIDVDFDIVWFSALLRYEEMYKHLFSVAKRGSLLMTKTSVADIFNFPANIYASDFGTGFSSLFAMLCALIKIGATNIYLIGFDGYAENEDDVYFGQKKMYSDNYRSRMMSIKKDTDVMNAMFWEYVEYSLNVSRCSLNITNLSGSSLKCFPQTDINTMVNNIGKGLLPPTVPKIKIPYRNPKRSIRITRAFVSPQYGNVNEGQILRMSISQARVFIDNNLAEIVDSNEKVSSVVHVKPIKRIIKIKRKRSKPKKKKIDSYYTIEHSELMKRINNLK